MAQGTRQKSRQMNYQSKLLKVSENDQLFQIIGNRCVSLATAVVQVYLADPPNAYKWRKQCCGVACFIKDNPKRSYFIRVYNLGNNHHGGSMIWEQELYNQFQYRAPCSYFHTFDTDDCEAGLNFANEDEANRFKFAMDEKLRQRAQRRRDRKRTNAPGPRQAPVPNNNPPGISMPSLPVAPSKDAEKKEKKEKKSKKKGKLSKEDIGTPTDFRHVGHVGWDPDKGFFDTNNLDPTLKALFDQVGISENQLQDQDTAKFIYDFIDKHGGVEAIKREQDKRPDNFRAAAPLPPAPPPSRAPAPSPAPPVPPSRMGAPPPPPPSRGPGRTMGAPPPPPPSKSALPPTPPRSFPAPPLPPPMSSPGPPPPPPPSGGPPPPPPPPGPPPPPMGGPPPPPPMGGPLPPPPAMGGPPPPPPVGGGRGDLLSAIQKGTNLKHISAEDRESNAPEDERGSLLAAIRKGKQLKTVDPSEQRKSDPGSESESSIAGALARALASRAKTVQGDSDEDSDEEDYDDEDWED